MLSGDNGSEFIIDRYIRTSTFIGENFKNFHRVIKILEAKNKKNQCSRGTILLKIPEMNSTCQRTLFHTFNAKFDIYYL